MSEAMQPNAPAWDLSDLYKGPEDPAIKEDLAAARKHAEEFAGTWRGRINTPGGPAPAEFARAIAEFAALAEVLGKVASYAGLLHAADSSKHEHGALLQYVQDQGVQVRQHLMFFELEWMDLSDEVADGLIKAAEVAPYLHWLAQQRKFRHHKLSEPEERMLDLLANTGSRAWQRFFDDTTAAMEFKVRRGNQAETMNESQALSLLYEADRSVRKNAATAITKTLASHGRQMTFVVNTLVHDHEVEDRVRKFDDPMAHRNLDNEIEPATVEALLGACEANFSIVQRYYKLKGRLLGIGRLKDYDRYAPVIGDMPEIDWDRCRRTVLDSFGDFSGQMADIAREFFDKRWIDALVRPGKAGGAFSAATVPGVHPYILMNFTGKLRDVLTMAHEMGHGVHQYLSRQVGYLEMHPPLTVSETASVFGEMVTFERVLGEQADSRVKLALLCSKIEDIFATVFRQAVLTRFEQRLHAARRAEGELATERISEIWMDANQPMHGKAVTLTSDYRWWWSYIGHFVHVPFYCYAYAFGELLVLALYKLYRRQGAAFVPGYIELLSKGGSVSPAELLAPLGVDIRQPDFWQNGLDQVGEYVTQAEGLAREAKIQG
jgi:oligoendopeptidase F